MSSDNFDSIVDGLSDTMEEPVGENLLVTETPSDDGDFENNSAIQESEESQVIPVIREVISLATAERSADTTEKVESSGEIFSQDLEEVTAASALTSEEVTAAASKPLGSPLDVSNTPDRHSSILSESDGNNYSPQLTISTSPLRPMVKVCTPPHDGSPKRDADLDSNRSSQPAESQDLFSSAPSSSTIHPPSLTQFKLNLFTMNKTKELSSELEMTQATHKSQLAQRKDLSSPPFVKLKSMESNELDETQPLSGKDDTPSISLSGQLLTSADTQPYFSQEDGQHPSTNPKQNVDDNDDDSCLSSPMKPPKKRLKYSIESQDTFGPNFGSQDPNQPDSQEFITLKSKSVKTKSLADGRVISYRTVKRRMVYVNEYFDDDGVLVHTELEPSSSSQSTLDSSGYLADRGSSVSGSQNSQDLILKTHRSSEDRFFRTPHSFRISHSAPPLCKVDETSQLPPLPTNPSKVLVSQQRHHILGTVNGHARQQEMKLKRKQKTLHGDERASVSQSVLPSVGKDTATLPGVTPPGATPHGVVEAEPSVEMKSPSKSSPLQIAESKLPSPHKKPKEKPKKRTVKKKKSSRSSQPSAIRHRSLRSLPTPQYVLGARVFAKWPSDGHFYSGTLARSDSHHVPIKWKVLFDDENVAYCPKNNILVVPFVPAGLIVHAKMLDYFETAIVLEAAEDGYSYLVKFIDNQTQTRLPSQNICLDSGQFFSLKLHVLSQLNSSTATDSENPAQRHLEAIRNTPQVEATYTSSRNMQRYKDIKTSPVKTREKQQEELPALPSTSTQLTFGETATNSKDIYQGFVFMVTSLRKDRIAMQVLQDSGDELSGNSIVDSSDEPSAADREEIIAKIESLGGVHIDKYDQDAVSAAVKCFLISAAFQRTVKYLQCLAANIPPVSYKWVEECYTHNRVEDETFYLLPAGIDIQSGCVVEWKPRRTESPLSDMSVFVVGGAAFLDDWRSILQIAGAHVVKKISINSGIRPEVVIVQSESCHTNRVSQATRLGIPVVSQEWAVQSLIKDIRLPFSSFQLNLY